MNKQNNCARARQLSNSTHNKLYDEMAQGQGTFPFKNMAWRELSTVAGITHNAIHKANTIKKTTRSNISRGSTNLSFRRYIHVNFPERQVLVVSPNVSPRCRKRNKQGQNIDLSNRFIFFTVSRPRGRPGSTYHVTDWD